MQNLVWKINIFIIIVILIVTSGCGKELPPIGDIDIDNPENSADAALYVKELVNDSIIDFIESFETIVINENTFAKLNKIFPEDPESNIMNCCNEGENYNYSQPENEKTDTNALKSEIKKGLNYFFANAKIEGDTVTYKPDKKLCQELIAVNDPDDCITGTGHIKISQTISDAKNGMMDFYFDQAHALRLIYNENTFQIIFYLSGIKEIAAFLQYNTEEFDGLPETMTGTVSLTVKRSASNIALLLGVQDDIRIIKELGEVYMDFCIEKSTNFLAAILDRTSKTATISANTKNIELLFPFADDQYIDNTVNVSIDALSGVVTLNDALRTINLRNISIGTREATFSFDEELMVLDFDPFNLELNFEGPNYTLNTDTGFDVGFSIMNGPQLTQNINIGSLPDTNLIFYPNDYLIKVQSGSFNFYAVGEVTGEIEVEPNACFSPVNDEFPFKKVNCGG